MTVSADISRGRRKMTMAKVRGNAFKKGQSGNPKGRPKGGKNRPKELTLEQEIEALTDRGTEHVEAGEIDAERAAFTKMFVLSGISRDKLPGAVDNIIEFVQIIVAKDDRLDIVQSLYENGHGDYFARVGLPKDATWKQFRALYTIGNDDVDADRALHDFTTYPPIAARIAEVKAEKAALLLKQRKNSGDGPSSQ